MNKKIITLGIITSLLTGIALTSVSADYDDGDYESGKKWGHSEYKQEYRGERDESMKGKKGGFHKGKGKNSEHREEMKELFENLDEETQAKLEELKSQHKEARKALYESYEDLRGDEEKRNELKTKMKELRDTHFAELKALLGDESEIIKKMEEHHAEMETKRAEKEEVREKKKVFKEQRADKISEYRTQFLEKIGDKIEKISDDKLKRILGKLEGLYTKTEANTSLSDEQKETTLSKIIALQDLITEKLEETDLDIEALIN